MSVRKVDVAIVGAGSAGLAAWRAARKHTDSVLLIEAGPHGTTCAWVGCMPSKLLIAAAEAAHAVVEAPGFGIDVAPPSVDGIAVMDRVRRERDRFVGFVLDSVDGIDAAFRVEGRARFVGESRLEIDNGDVVDADRIVVATGSSPQVPSLFDGLGDRLVVNDDVFGWHDLPESVAVFGPGVIGLELGQALARLGVRVQMFGIDGTIGPLTDPAVTEAARLAFEGEFDLDPEADVRSIRRLEDGVEIPYLGREGVERSTRVEYVLAATGRRANVAGLGLDNTPVPLDERGLPVVDASTLRAGDTRIFIAGDATGDKPLLHEAADEGRIAGDNAGRFPHVIEGLRRSPLGIVFSDPQIAMIGERFADLRGRGIVIGEVSFDNQGRSRVMRQNRGLLRVYADRRDGRFLGAEIAGPRAEHIGHLLAWAHQSRLTIADMLDMPFYHPVIEEGLRTALRDACRQLADCMLRAA